MGPLEVWVREHMAGSNSYFLYLYLLIALTTVFLLVHSLEHSCYKRLVIVVPLYSKIYKYGHWKMRRIYFPVSI